MQLVGEVVVIALVHRLVQVVVVAGGEMEIHHKVVQQVMLAVTLPLKDILVEIRLVVVTTGVEAVVVAPVLLVLMVVLMLVVMVVMVQVAVLQVQQ